jgi:hypothetical protein
MGLLYLYLSDLCVVSQLTLHHISMLIPMLTNVYHGTLKIYLNLIKVLLLHIRHVRRDSVAAVFTRLCDGRSRFLFLTGVTGIKLLQKSHTFF